MIIIKTTDELFALIEHREKLLTLTGELLDFIDGKTVLTKQELSDLCARGCELLARID